MLTLSPTAARRFLIHAFALSGFQTLPDVATAVDRLQFVQEDSINVCGRIHDLILWARVRDYSPALLHDLLYGEPRRAFEYDFPNLCVLPLRDYPYFVRAMRERAASTHGWHSLSTEEWEVASWVLERIDAEGPMRTRATGKAHGHTRSAWGTQTTRAARVMERLWRHGTLTIARRDNFERTFDRTSRLLPEVAGLHEPDTAADLPGAEETAAYLARKRLRAKRVFRLRPHDKQVLGEAAFVRVAVEGITRPWYALAEDVDALANAESLPVSNDVLFLAPLDPLVYDRERTRLLFDFEYMWEVYTPEAKRRWGYYVLPVLRGDRLVGRMDPKVDRKTRTLTLHRLSLEPGVEADESLTAALAGRLGQYARFLGAERIRLPERGTEPEQLGENIAAHVGADGLELIKK